MEAPHEELTDDALAGPYRVLQRRRGHRYSLDDTVTAWVAARARPDARSVLDLGTGLGSVLLMLAHKLPQARLWGIEAQPESHALLARNCERNGLLGAEGRVRIELGDFREPGRVERVRCEAGSEGVELVTGTPPYQPLGRGTLSPDPQRAHARVELRGGVEAYLDAGARALAPGGALVVCADARTPERVLGVAPERGLTVVQRLDVVPAAGKAALFSVFTLVKAEPGRAGDAAHGGIAPALRGGAMSVVPAADFVARDAHGRRTREALALRRFFDLPAAEHDAPSPRLRPRAQQARS